MEEDKINVECKRMLPLSIGDASRKLVLLEILGLVSLLLNVF